MRKGKKPLAPGPIAFPDPIWRLDMISAAALLYFEEPIGLTTLPTVSILSPEPFELVQLIRRRNAPWSQEFLSTFDIWRHQHDSFQKTGEILEPLRGTTFKSIWLIYPRGSSALATSTQLLKSTKRKDAIILPLC